MTDDQKALLIKTAGSYRRTASNASKTVTRLNAIQRAEARGQKYPWGKKLEQLEQSARAASDAEDEAWKNLAEWANSVE